MAIYYFIICSLTGLGFFMTEKQNKTRMTRCYLAIAFVSLTLLASLRYAIGFDYFSYRNIFEMTAGWSFGSIFSSYCRSEPLFFVLCKCFQLAGLPFQMLLAAVSAFLVFMIVWMVLRFSAIPWMSIFLYITLQFFAYHMNLMRQSIALCFFLLAWPYWKKRRFLPWAALLFIGGLFHNSLWLICPLFILLPKKLTRRSVGCLAALTICGYLLFDPLFLLVRPLLPEKYAIYDTTFFWHSNDWEYLVLPALYCLLIYLFRSRIRDEYQRTVYVNSAFYYVLFSLFITKHFILERFAIYPFIFALFAIPDILASYRPKDGETLHSTRRYYCMMALFVAFGAAFFLFSAAKGFHNVYPYVSLLDRSRSVPAAAVWIYPQA